MSAERSCAPAPQAQLDTRAIEIASQARGVIDAHIQECGRRYQEQAVAMRDIQADMRAQDAKRSEGFDRIYHELGRTRADVFAAIDGSRGEAERWRRSVYIAVIAILLSALGFLVVNGRPWMHPHGQDVPARSGRL